MPFKDLATSDAMFLRDVPPADDLYARQALSRLAVRARPGAACSAGALQAWP